MNKLDTLLYDIFGFVAEKYSVEWKLDEVIEEYKDYRKASNKESKESKAPREAPEG